MPREEYQNHYRRNTDDRTKNAKGSPSRDAFKKAHKNINKKFYASDCDLSFISFEPRGVVAYIDYKKPGDTVTKTEEVLYDEWTKTKPVFIIEGLDPENGPFKVSRYKKEGTTEFICTLNNWQEFEKWEASVRENFQATG